MRSPVPFVASSRAASSWMVVPRGGGVVGEFQLVYALLVLTVEMPTKEARGYLLIQFYGRIEWY